MKFYDAMMDVECMGMPPTGALIGIGCCFFDLDTETIGPTFYRSINLATSVREGGTIDPATVMFWLTQSDAARNAVRYNTQDIRKVLGDFSDWIAETCRHEDVRMYGNSSGFDCTLVDGAYKRMGMKAPWHFSRERCFRTVRNLYPSVKYDPAEKGDNAHNALADAVFQAEHLFRIKNRNRGR